MKKAFYIFTIVGLLTSCGGSDEASNPETTDETIHHNVVEDTGDRIDVGGIKLPSNLEFGGSVREFTGAGTRVKFFMRIYVLALYMEEPSKDQEVIINADKPMSMRMHIISSMLTSEVMNKYIREGFDRSLGEKSAEVKSHLDLICSEFSSEPTEVGDVYDLHYTPGAGMSGSKNGVMYNFDNLDKEVDDSNRSTQMLQLKHTKDGDAAIPGFLFKKGLFGVWLSDDPVDANLKDEILEE